ncbi:bifunctional glycosyltransferase/CDP-glycerol:glycerophosphate glycerophosphotransferase [Bacillus halotolerans]|uniref:bifunctional glycosyltransferase/CDP-glycerol:glycerophosphate glycerophosphotransferase n=1 Tax=Bacillus halotolerans TaxID=260554 RepID=UPI00192BA5AA|nr:bifunctional glycosyltransferase family 2 protein/CDP-glycerol:glycerophosphate glycerophosphotransferase [Bacillus halotolerans]MBL4966664.1 bifunctional glycosyltransferase family 2 protein/CDP-glycerol:glycerophosphate glycerophosphotransferase [Bacillus halotolerans]
MIDAYEEDVIEQDILEPIEDIGKVSIIIPFYNTKDYIEECLHSVLEQTYENLEIIIVNDGSAEEDTAFLEQILPEDSRIVYVESEKHKGVASARNIGLNVSTGRFLYFLDSDDVITKNAIELLTKYIKDNQLIVGTTKRLNKPLDLMNITLRNKSKVLVIKKLFMVFKNRSVLNMLIRRDVFNDTESCSFYEGTNCFTDISLLVKLISKIEKISVIKQPIYYKRRRNDPITNPSVMQLSNEIKTKDFITIYEYLHEIYRNNEKVIRYLDLLFLNFYRKNIVLLFKDIEKVDQFFENIAIAAKRLSRRALSNQPLHIRLEMKQLRNENIKKYKKSIKTHLEIRSLRQGLKSLKKFKIYCYRKFFIKMPFKENYIVFESFLGKNYSDSPRDIYEYMVDNNLDYKYVWIFNDKHKKIPGPAKVVKRFSFKYYYYLGVSRYWVSNSRIPMHIDKRKENIYLQTWHGTPLKRLVFDMKEIYSANPNYKKNFYIQSRRWDYLIAPNKYSSEIFKSAFLFEKNMLETGYPRNDILYRDNQPKKINDIKAKIGIPLDKKVILYAPTWRDDDFYAAGKYKFNLKLDLQKMKEKLGEDYVIALRMHYFIADEIKTDGVEDFAFNLSKYDEIAELYLISDILITDYSSVFFDYANLKRPILFFAYDLEKYRDKLRGFYINIEEDVPGPVVKTSNDVINSILNIEDVQHQFKEKYDDFYARFCSWHDGNSTEKVVKQVFLESN